MSQINTKWVYDGVEYDLDLTDAAVAAKYEKAFAVMGENEKKVKKDVGFAEFVRQYCKLFSDLFDGLFGEGTYAKLSKGKVENINTANEIYESFLEFASAQADAVISNQNRFFGKYSPNRAQRRASKHGKA